MFSQFLQFLCVTFPVVSLMCAVSSAGAAKYAWFVADIVHISEIYRGVKVYGPDSSQQNFVIQIFFAFESL